MTMLQESFTNASAARSPKHYDEHVVWLQLRQATRAAHESIEQNPYLKRLLADDLSRQEYAGILRKLAVFYAPLEQEWLRWAPHFPAELEIERRAGKTALLLADLAALNERLPSPAEHASAAFRPFRSIEEVWGCIYVIEGSTLGGQLIAKALLTSLNLTNNDGASFYAPYGQATGLKWQIFRKALNAAVESQALDLDGMIAGARQTFATLDRWMASSP